MQSRSRRQLRDEIKKLLKNSNLQGRGPHGTTINAVMNRVDRIMNIFVVRRLK